MDQYAILDRSGYLRVIGLFATLLMTISALAQPILKVTGVSAGDSNSLQEELKSDPPFQSVTANPTAGRAPLIVQYQGKVFPADPTTKWLWQFPGGKPSTSTLQNPIVRYNRKGIYDATVSASNSFGSTNIILKNYIEVTGGNTKPTELTPAYIEINPLTGGEQEIVTRSTDKDFPLFLVDPNPARDEIRVRNTGDEEVEEIVIYSAAGQMLQIIPWPGQRKEYILHLNDQVKPDGIYWLQVRTANRGEWIKIAVIGR